MIQVIAQRYQLLEEVGKGGMGTVYRGLDTQSQQTVAIKQLKPELTSPELLERFVREGAALRELNHPNIVKMLDEVEEQGQHYLIIEYLPGGDLNSLLKVGRLPIEKVLQMAIDICDALTRAHRLNIIHRDLKPANVLIAEDDTPRLTDFGIAHMAEKERVTDTQAIIGTIDYLAPETLNGEAVDPRADIWAFGVMLFEMLAGERPFTGATLTEILTVILTQPVPDLEVLRPDIPIALVDLVYRMLEKERNARIRSVRYVGAELEDILQGRSTRTPPETRFATPAPDILSRPKHNLPAQTTPFVGREAELRELTKLLEDPNIRLITILAPGGMGKSRLALETAAQHVGEGLRPSSTPDLFADGVYFVELAPLSDPANIVSAIAEATGYQFQGDGREPKQQILDFLRNKNMLLVLDNYEHLLDGAGLVTDILQAAPDVQILATSRQRLSQPGETLFHLAGMDFPTWETPEDALEYAAVKLFMNSAQRARPAFELKEHNLDDIARICRLVQGMPLAIVLAASWLAMLSLSEIAAEIQQSLDFLADEAGQVPERQHSIRAVFDYSWQQMTADEQQVFMKLSVFRGGFTREAAQAVADTNLRTLLNLMNKSLIRRDANSGRYDIHELLRQYADEKLKVAGDLADIRDTHMRYFADFMHQRTPDIKGRKQLEGLKEIEVDFENVHFAWNRAVEQGEYDMLDHMMEGLALYCDMRSKYQIGADLFQKAVKHLSPFNADAIHPTFNQLQVRYTQVWALPEQRPVPHHIRQQLTHSLTLAQQHDDYATIGLCLWLRGEIERIDKNLRDAILLFEQAQLHYELLDEDYYIGRILRGVVFCLNNLGAINEESTRNLNRKHLEITRSSGDRSGMSHALLYDIAFIDYEAGSQRLRETINIWRETGDWKSVGIALWVLSGNIYLCGMFDEARILANEARRLLQDCGWTDIDISEPSILLNLIAVFKGEVVSSRQILEEDVTQYSIAAFSPDKDTLIKGMAIAVLALLDKEKYEQHILSSLQVVHKPFIPIAAAGCVAVIGVIFAEQGERERATKLLGLAFNYEDDYLMGWMNKWSRLTRLRDQLKTELGEEAYNTAWERGKSLDLEAVVQELLAEFGDETDS